MDLKEQMDHLTRLRDDRNAWQHNELRSTYMAMFGGIRLNVVEGDTEVRWTLVDDGVQQWQGLSGSVKQAMMEACDFTRAYLNSQVNTTHLVN